MPDVNPIQPPLRETPHQARTEQKTARSDSGQTVQHKTNFDAQPMKAAVNEMLNRESRETAPQQQTALHHSPETSKQQILSPPPVHIKQAEMKDGFNPASTIVRPKEFDERPKGDQNPLQRNDEVGRDSTSAALVAKQTLENDSTIPRPLMDKVKQEIAETIGAVSSLPQARGRLLLLGPDNNEMTQLAALLELAGYVAPVMTTVGVGSHYILTHPPDMLLLDLATAGYEAMFAPLRNSPVVKDLPVLALTSSGYPLSAEEAPQYGFAGVVSKELPPTEFPKVVTEFFIQLCPEKVEGGGEGAVLAEGGAVAARVTFSEGLELEQALDTILGQAGSRGRQLRGFLLQVADMTKEAAAMGEELKRLESLTGTAPASLSSAASVQEIHRFLSESGESPTPLEKVSYLQTGLDMVQQRVQETKERAARQAMQLSSRLLQLPHLVGDFIRNLGSVTPVAPAPGQVDPESFQQVLNIVVGQAREQAHSLGTILGRMEANEPLPAPGAVSPEEADLPSSSSAFDILPGLAQVLGSTQQQAS